MRIRRLRFPAILLTSIVSVLISSPVRAQSRRIGFLDENQAVLKAGVSGSTLSSDPGTGMNVGFAGGISFLVGRSDLGGWQLEALVHQKGATDSVQSDDSLRITYIEGAALLHLDLAQFGRADRNAFYVIGGPALSAKVHASYAGGNQTRAFVNMIRDIDFGLIAGGGLECGGLVLEGRYEWGFVSVFKEPLASVENRTFAAMVGYRF